MKISRKRLKEIVEEEMSEPALTECGMTDEPLPMPGPPPEPNRALEPVYDDDEGQMAMGQLSRLVNDAGELTNLLGGQTQLPSWVQAKVTKATDYISAVKNYLQYQQHAPQGLHEMKITKQRLIKIIKEEMQLETWKSEGGPTQTPAEQEYDALTTMIQRLDGMQGFLLNTTRQKSDEALTQQAAEQLNALRDILSQLRKGL